MTASSIALPTTRKTSEAVLRGGKFQISILLKAWRIATRAARKEDIHPSRRVIHFRQAYLNLSSLYVASSASTVYWIDSQTRRRIDGHDGRCPQVLGAKENGPGWRSETGLSDVRNSLDQGAFELLSPFPCCPLSRSVGGKAVLSLHCMIWPALICHWAPPPMREFFLLSLLSCRDAQNRPAAGPGSDERLPWSYH